MKKLIIFVIILIASILNARVIEHSYYFEDPIIEEKGEYSTINFEGTTQMGIVGKPTLPFQAVKLGLQQYEIADRIEIIGLNPIFLEEEINLFPRQHSRPLSDKREMKFEIDNNFYQSNAKYPQKSYTHINTEFFHGNPIALSTITPVEYNSREKQLTYFSEMVVKIYTKTNNQNLNIPEILNSKIVKNYVDNPEDIPYSSRTREVNIEIIVITPAEFIDDFAGYQDFYSQKGYNVEMYGVETIYANYEGVDNQEKIRNFIIEQYNENQMEFVLLGGDIEHIPVRGFFCSVQSSQVYEDENIPSDLYYSALDGSWNDDNDELWGEIGEDDLLPEVSVGRLPFSNVNELENMLTKLFSYQNNPVIEDLDKPLLAGEYLYDDPITWGADYLEMLVGYHEEHGYQTNGIPEDSDYYTLFERDVDSWSGADLINSLEEGSSFLHHVGHANQYYVAHLQSSDITDENFSEINGIDNNHTIMYTHGCICGSFDTDDCIAEEMLKIENFAVGFIGNSRYGWFNEGQTEGPSGHIHREFVDAIYGDKTAAIGKAHKESKYDTAPFVTAEDQWEEGALRWCFYDCNVLADPAMKVWTDQLIEPEIITNEVIPMGIESHMITVQNEGTNLENIHCALIIDNEIFASAVTDEDGVALFQFGSEFQNPSLGTIVVDGYNLITTSHEVYIVNDEEPLL
ncbi:MAG: C25 family cysteine peptidase, partial [Candidatus Cloacimonadota bacterium]|nr:C25 family cysteine peptidase [Candidatus Cloacimonadota bacterium]